jgi:hypothetical protein
VCSALALSGDGATLAVSTESLSGQPIEYFEDTIFVFKYLRQVWVEVQVRTGLLTSAYWFVGDLGYRSIVADLCPASPQVLMRPIATNRLGYSMAFSSDAVYLAVSEQQDNYPNQVIASLAYRCVI